MEQTPYDGFLEIIRSKINLPTDDCYLADDGLLYCKKCKTARETTIFYGGVNMKMPCVCRCMEIQQEQERHKLEEHQRMIAVERAKDVAFVEKELQKCTFDKSDTDNRMMRVCKAYAEKFKPDTKWLILYGGCGTGKTFAAGCIANQLVDNGNTVRMFTLPQFERIVWQSVNKDEPYRTIRTVDLVVLDDFGVQRNTQYQNEILFTLIDERLQSGKPMVITTNLTPDEIFNPSDITSKRIMSRIYEKSAMLIADGGDRRRRNIVKSSTGFIEGLLSD